MAKLGDQAVGSIVKLNVNGTARNFIVVHQGLPSSAYDSSCNSTWLLMEDCYDSMKYGNDNSYPASTVHSYLNNTFINLLDEDIKNIITSVKIPYTNGTGLSSNQTLSGSNGLSVKVFSLSASEVGGWSNARVEGAVLDYFKDANSSKLMAKLNGSYKAWWLRSPQDNDKSSAVQVSAYGSIQGYPASIAHGVRPALMLPLNLAVDGSGNVVVKKFSGYANIGGVNKELSGGYVNIGGAWKEISGAYMNVGGVWKPMA